MAETEKKIRITFILFMLYQKWNYYVLCTETKNDETNNNVHLTTDICIWHEKKKNLSEDSKPRGKEEINSRNSDRC